MSNKLYTLISSLVTLAAGTAIALLNYFQPAHLTAIEDSIITAQGAIIIILGNFADKIELKKK